MKELSPGGVADQEDQHSSPESGLQFPFRHKSWGLLMSIRRSALVPGSDDSRSVTSRGERQSRLWGWGVAGLLAAVGLWSGAVPTWAQSPTQNSESAGVAMTSGDESGSVAFTPFEFPQISLPTYPNEPPVVGGMGIKGRIRGQAGTTVGQSQPITGFDISPYLFEGNLILFGEGRLVVGNNGKAGGSLGAGARHFFPRLNSIVGASAWWDIDATRGPTFRQWGISTELLSEFLDIRGNLYVPYGELTKVTDVRFEPGSQQFIDRPITDVQPGEAQGSYLSFQRRIFSATALQGFDTLFTIPMPGDFARSLNLETSAGFYGYEAKDGSVDQTYGWRLRFDIDVLERLSHMFLEINHDSKFKTNVAFVADINYWGKLDHRPRLGHSQYNRLAEWVRRNRTTVALETSALADPEIAINPRTGDPYVVYIAFQDTEGDMSGSGTVSDPFRNVQNAINTPGADIIFVEGNSVMESGLLVDVDNNGDALDYLMIIGEQEVPSVGIPVQGLSQDIFLPTITTTPFDTPVIQNVVGDNALTINANSVKFAAIDITNITDGDAIHVNPGVDGGMFESVNITTVNNGNGLNMIGATGTFNLTEIVIEDIEGNALNIVGGDASVQVSAGTPSQIDNTTNSHASHGYAVNIEDTSGGSINLSNLLIQDTGGQGIRVYGSTAGSSLANVTFGTTTLTDTVVAAPTGTEIATGAVYIRNHGGSVSFVDTLTIDGIDDVLGGDSFVVESLQSGGSVFTQGTLNINDRRGRGIYVVDIEDSGNVNPAQVFFNGPVNIVGLGTGYTGSDSAVLFESNSGALIFGGSLVVNGSLGNGVEVTDGTAGAPVGTDEGFFQANNVTITNVSGSGGTSGVSFYLHDITKTSFNAVINGLVINNRGSADSDGLFGAGILITDFHGTANFSGGGTTVSNQLDSFANAIEVQTNSTTGTVGFGQTTVNDQLGTGSYGILAVNNFNTTTAGVSFSRVDVTSTDAIGVSLQDNGIVSISRGTIDVTGARGIEVFTLNNTDLQVHSITLNEVSATSSDYGIFVQDSLGSFNVIGTSATADSGGVITGMSEAGAFFQNTQTVDLNWMRFNGNERGVEAQDMLQRRPGNNTDPSMTISNTVINGSSSEGIYLEDVSDFTLEDSTVTSNGQTNSEEQIEILATVSEIDIDNDGTDEDVEYTFTFDNNNIVDASGTAISATDMIYIHTDAAINDPVDLTLTFTNNGAPTPTTNTNSITSNRAGGSAAIDVTWEGVTNATFNTNQFNLLTGDGQIGLDLTIDGTGSVINYTNNGMNGTGPNVTGIRTSFAQAVTLNIFDNQALDVNGNILGGSGFQFSGESSTGLDLTFLTAGSTVNINNNLMQFTGFGSTGIQFTRIAGSAANTSVAIGGNSIFRQVNVNDTLVEEGIYFEVIQGTIRLVNTGDNFVQFGTFLPFYRDFFMPNPASAAGTSISVNGVLYP